MRGERVAAVIYLLDTNACIHYLKYPESAVARQVEALHPSDLAVSDAIARGKRAIAFEIATALAETFGTSVEFWTTLDANYRFHLAQVDIGNGLA